MTFTEFLFCAFNVNNHQKYITIKGLQGAVWGFYSIVSISDEKYHDEVLDVYCSFLCNAW